MSATAQHWLVKQEPTTYSWTQFVTDRRTVWTGVRNFQARNHLRAMRAGDLVLFYHSVIGKEVVGIARVVAEAYPDPTATDGEWVCVDLVPLRALPNPVPLAMIKTTPELRDVALLRQARLSVVPIRPEEFRAIERLGADNSVDNASQHARERTA